MSATIKDIARQVGVSVSTVSYALNGGPRPVRDDIRDRVLAVAAALDYRPNNVARSLITRRTHTIGVVPTELAPNLTQSPYFAGCLGGIVNAAESLGQDVILFTRFDQSSVGPFVNALLDGRADGLIFLAPVVGSPVLDQLKHRVPLVIGNGAEIPGIPSFVCDNMAGVHQAVRHLVDLGHRHIGNLHGPGHLQDAIDRIHAFKAAIADFELELRPEWIANGAFTPMGGYEAGYRMLTLPNRPTAIFCANDEMAAGVLQAAYSLGLQVPQDLSVIGFDDSPSARLFHPALTTVRQPLEELGAKALTTLIDLVNGKETAIHLQFPTELVVRDSTSRPKEDY